MEGTPKKEPTCEQPSEQFEVYIYGQRSETSLKAWHCRLLPPPPFVCDPSKRCPLVTSYAVVDDGSRIVVSAEGAGTYLMDTVNHTWEEVGGWMLPLYGKVEYVPELNLWFGLSVNGQLAAADRSTNSMMESRPRLFGKWKEFNSPEEWRETQEPQLVNLGSGRFCVARFFDTVRTTKFGYDDEVIDREFTVFTGVEVVPRVYSNGNTRGSNGNCSGSDNGNGSYNGNGNCSGSGNGNGNHNCSGNGNNNGGKRKVKLQMITHMSRCQVSANGTTVQSVF